MKKSLLVIGAIIFLMTTFLSGCQEQEATKVENNFEGIIFESDVFELVYASLDFFKEQNIIIRAEVTYLFRNIAGRDVDANVLVKLYDKNDNLLHEETPKTFSLLKDYVEQGIGPANVVKYSGEKVSEVDYAKIIAIEK